MIYNPIPLRGPLGRIKGGRKYIRYRDIIYGLAVLIAFALPFHIQLTRYLIGGFIGVWLLELIVKNGPGRMPRQLFRQVKHQRLIWLVIAFYLFHVLSLVVSSNVEQAFFDLERKLTLLLIPLAFSSLPTIKEKRQHHILISFVAANGVIALICTGFFIDRLLDPVYFKKFLDYPLYYIYRDFSLFNHPTYFALFMGLSVAFLLYLYHQRQTLISRRWIVVMVVFFSLLVFVISSRAAIIVLVVLFLLTIFHYGRSPAVKIALLAGLVVLSTLGLTNYRFNNYLELAGKVIQGKKIDSRELIEQDALRFLLWDVTVDLTRQNLWLGTGTGDIRKDLKEEYARRDILKHMQRTFNPHNQYLSTLLGVGIFGMLVLLSILIWPLILACRRRDYLGMSLLIVFLLNLAFESMLNRSPGILSFAFFYGWIIVHRYREDPQDEIE